MSITSPSFVTVTVTATVTGTPVYTLNATQLHQLAESKETGQVVAFVSLGVFGLLAAILLICLGVLRARRPPPPSMIENPDAIKHGRGAFLPAIGMKRKSTRGLDGTIARNAASQQSLIGSTETLPRRLSMWADETNASRLSIPSPPTFAVHSRSPSPSSVERVGRRHQRSDSASSMMSHTSASSRYHHYTTRYQNNSSSSLDPPQDLPPPAVPPKIGHVQHVPGVEVSR